MAGLLGLTASNLLRIAAIVVELEKRGEDLSEIKVGLLPILRSIASGRLLPEIVVMFFGDTGKLRLIGAMPLEVQHQIVSGKVLMPTSARIPYDMSKPSLKKIEKMGRPGDEVEESVKAQSPHDKCLAELNRLAKEYGNLQEFKAVFDAVAAVASVG